MNSTVSNPQHRGPRRAHHRRDWRLTTMGGVLLGVVISSALWGVLLAGLWAVIR